MLGITTMVYLWQKGVLVLSVAEELMVKKRSFFNLMKWEFRVKSKPENYHQAKWACVNNQFFVNIVRPTTDISNTWISGRAIQNPANRKKKDQGVTGSISFPWEYSGPINQRNLLFRFMRA